MAQSGSEDQFEKQLRETQANLVAIIENTLDSIWAIDTSYNIIYINQVFQRAFEASFGTKLVIGSSILEALPEVLRPLWKSRYDRAFAGERFIFEDAVPAGPVTIYIEAAMNPIVDQGRVIGASFFARDITGRKVAEEERNQLNAQLQVKNRELEQVVYVASHDLRSPLVNIDGYSKELGLQLKDIRSLLDRRDLTLEALKQELQAPFKEMEEDLAFIRSSTAQMDSLLTGLLKLSRLGRSALSIMPLAMGDLVARVVDSAEYQLKALQAQVTILPLPNCLGDPVQVSQIFANLLNNAIKYRSLDRPLKLEIRGTLEAGRGVFVVEDNGIGIDKKHQEKIFDVFHRLNPKESEGEGLGLAIVRQAVGRLGGEVWVESSPGVGSQFFVALPAAAGAEILSE